MARPLASSIPPAGPSRRDEIGQHHRQHGHHEHHRGDHRQPVPPNRVRKQLPLRDGSTDILGLVEGRRRFVGDGGLGRSVIPDPRVEEAVAMSANRFMITVMIPMAITTP